MSLRRCIACSNRPLASIRLAHFATFTAASSFALASPKISAPARPQIRARNSEISIRPLSTTTARLDKMKCILIKEGKGPVENLYMGEEETPEPAKGQVQVKIKVG